MKKLLFMVMGMFLMSGCIFVDIEHGRYHEKNGFNVPCSYCGTYREIKIAKAGRSSVYVDTSHRN